ncbi:MAG: DUF3253 domain-containing protein [Acidobacteriaceae bacterium]
MDEGWSGDGGGDFAAAGGAWSWEPLMEPVRVVARRMVVEGKIVITQKGRVVDGETAKGAVRLRLR